MHAHSLSAVACSPLWSEFYINILLCFSGLLLHIIFQSLMSFGHGERFFSIYGGVVILLM